MSPAAFSRQDKVNKSNVIEEHAEKAAIQWSFRDAAVNGHDHDLDDLADLDERIEAHLDGLRIAVAARRWAALSAAVGVPMTTASGGSQSVTAVRSVFER